MSAVSEAEQIKGQNEARGDRARIGVAERSHAGVREQLSDGLDGTLPADERRRVDAHLAECSACSAYQRTLERTVRTLQSLPPLKAPADAKRRVLESLP